jgi:guanylate kinase
VLNKNEKCIVVGQSGSGKDFLMRKLVEEGLKASVKTTTRPMRKHEIQSVTYNFTTLNEFDQLLESGQFICYQTFKVQPADRPEETWFYGLTKSEFESSQVFIMTPGEIEQIEPETRKKCFIVYLDIDRSIRESRLLRREDKNDSVKRRLDADEIDFKHFKDYDLKITDPEFLATDVLSLMD